MIYNPLYLQNFNYQSLYKPPNWHKDKLDVKNCPKGTQILKIYHLPFLHIDKKWLDMGFEKTYGNDVSLPYFFLTF